VHPLVLQSFFETLIKEASLIGLPRKERLAETQRVADQYFTPERYPQLSHIKAKALPTWFGLGAPDIEIEARSKDTNRNIFSGDFFSQGRGYASLHKKPFQDQYDLEGDALYLKKNQQGKGIGSAMFRDLAAAGRDLGAENLNLQADEAGKHVWARQPGVLFQKDEAKRAPKAYAKWRRKNEGPDLAPDAAPSEYPREFLQQWSPYASDGAPFIGYKIPLQKQADVATPLKDYQERVKQKMLEPNRRGLVVAHGLGTGKTLSSIAAQDALKMPATVAVPAALQANYEKERAKHLTGETQPADIVSLQRGALEGKLPESKLLIVDESHRARDPASATFRALRDTPAEKKMLLTGSPFYNSPHDLAPLINIAAGENVLPNDKAEFDSQYTRHRKVGPGFFGRLQGLKPGEVQELNPHAAKKLKKVYDEYVDYQPGGTEGFPTVTRENVDVPMSKEQLQIYDTMMGKAPAWVARKVRKGLPPSKSEAASMNSFLTGPRQVGLSSSPFVQEGAKTHSTKIDEAFKHLQHEFETNPEARAVIYSNFIDSGVKPYAQRLTEAGIPFGQYTGEVPRHDRDQLVRDYNEGKKKVLLLSSAGGEGLDLKGTRLIQMLEPHWNQEKLKQVEGRGIRYGSHEALPEDQRNVRVESYRATRPRQGILQHLHVKKPGSAADEYLSQRSDEKERLNQEFRNLLATQRTEESHA
jgi:SNF2 family DNA or RNA helicase